ncbi:MAG TPA: hypothetical protein P5107_10780 [Thermotogota bacterium]|nr:hypothetical protein [Thermotogota bacterium]
MPSVTKILLAGESQSGKSTILALFFEYFLKNDISDLYIVAEKDSVTMNYLSTLHRIYSNAEYIPTEGTHEINLEISQMASSDWRYFSITDTSGEDLDEIIREKKESAFDAVFYTVNLFSITSGKKEDVYEHISAFLDRNTSLFLVFTEIDTDHFESDAFFTQKHFTDIPFMEIGFLPETRYKNILEMEKGLAFLFQLSERQDVKGKLGEAKIQDYFRKIMTKTNFNFFKKKNDGESS